MQSLPKIRLYYKVLTVNTNLYIFMCILYYHNPLNKTLISVDIFLTHISVCVSWLLLIKTSGISVCQ